MTDLPGDPTSPPAQLTPPYPSDVGTGYQAPVVRQQGGYVGEIRSTGLCFLLFTVTFGIYGCVWYYKVHKEMKRHAIEGIGGGLALVLALIPIVSLVMYFLSPPEVGKLFERRGQRPPVSGVTGLWIVLPIAGPIVWFVKTNGALNAYWRSLGAHG
jgi:hypothetical protein